MSYNKPHKWRLKRIDKENNKTYYTHTCDRCDTTIKTPDLEWWNTVKNSGCPAVKEIWEK